MTALVGREVERTFSVSRDKGLDLRARSRTRPEPNETQRQNLGDLVEPFDGGEALYICGSYQWWLPL